MPLFFRASKNIVPVSPSYHVWQQLRKYINHRKIQIFKTGFPIIVSYLQNLRARLRMFRTELVDGASGEPRGTSVGGDSIIVCSPSPGSDHFTLYANADNTDISEMMNWILQHKSKARDDISYLVVAASPPSVWNTKGGQKSDNTNP